jgi:hypothetical protein
MKLYHHKTDGGAEYLFDTYVKCPNGEREGAIKDHTRVVVRLDGQPEINGSIVNTHAQLVEALEHFFTWHAERFGVFNDEINAELLCLANEAEAALAAAKGE